MLQLDQQRSCSVSHPDPSQVSHLGGWVQTCELDIWGMEMGGSHKLGALGSLFSIFPEITNVGTGMENKGWGLQAWRALCCSRPSHCSEDKPQTAACEVLRAQWQAATPKLPRVYPKRIPRNACRLVLPWTDWNKPQDSTLFLLFPRTLQLHIFPAQVKVNSTSSTEMRKKNLALP